MIIDNTSLIRSLLDFPAMDKDHILKDNVFDDQMKDKSKNNTSKSVDMRECFYNVQLLQRMKDNPVKIYGNPNYRNNSNRSIMQFQIYSLQDYDLKIPNIIELAKLYQCRVYMELNLRDSKDVYSSMYQKMCDRFKTCNYLKLHRLFNEAIGDTNIMKGSRETWIVDIDTKDENTINEVKNCVLALRGGGPNKMCRVYGIVPTKNGVHLITSSFEVNEFKEKYKDIDIQKRNPTIVWMETDWTLNEHDRKEIKNAN